MVFLERKIIFYFFLLLLFLYCPVVDALDIPEVTIEDGVLRAGSGWRIDLEGLRVGFLSGSPEEIGMQHGLLMTDDPEELRQKMLDKQPFAHPETLGERLTGFFLNTYARFQFYPAFLRHTSEEYIREMRGFVLGASGGEEEDIYDVMMGNAAQDLEIAACSAFAAWGEATQDGEIYVGRNLDHGGMLDLAGYQVLAIYNPEKGYRFAVHNYPAFVGTMSGMNEKGLVISSNYSMARREEITINGLPYMFMLRNVLQNAATINEALEIIKNTPRTIGLTLLLADGKTPEAVVVEITANRMQVRTGEDYIFAANRYLHPEMKEFQAGGWLASALREKRLQELITDKFWGEIDVPITRDIMRDRLPPEGFNQENFGQGINHEVNMASMVMVPSRGEFWVGAVDDSEIPFAADAHFVGVDVRKIWETGEPPREPIGILQATPREGYEGYWFKAREANLLLGQGKREEALELLEEVLSAYPRAEMPLLMVGRALIRQGEIEKGTAYLERFAALENHSEPFHQMEGYFWLAVVYDQVGEREKAVEYYRRSLQVQIEDMPPVEGGYHYFAEKGLETPLKLTPEGRVYIP